MKRSTRLEFFFFIAVIALISILPARSFAFYEYKGDENQLELKGFLRLIGGVNLNPDNRAFYERETSTSAGVVGRILLDARAGQKAAFELNAYEFTYYSGIGAGSTDFLGVTPGSAERSSALSWVNHRSSDTVNIIAVDRLNVKLNLDDVEVILGRQAINLSTAIYFTPNDFFAPFSAQDFFRIYKPGVDALRTVVGLGPLSEVSLIAVLGYETEAGSSNGWSTEPSLKDSSAVIRLSTTARDLEWALVAGTVRDRNILGGSVQGEVLRGVDLRVEGHYAVPEDNSLDAFTELSLGLAHTFPNDFDIKGEFFYHGAGIGDRDNYGASLFTTSSTLPYLARQYLAIGAGYKVNPLLRVDGVAIMNLVDQSALLAFNALYSLSNESEFSFSLILPTGRETSTGASAINSEFGLYPVSAVFELRAYF
ncbi:MAG: hypothetical protein BMS9Abin23_0699 [Thermodesulfobacteriota bacterium]|nr:MAG: hypothetical protein BMS9Abin23_0699 [Thermodesulfobacteriota bacterium]